MTMTADRSRVQRVFRREALERLGSAEPLDRPGTLAASRLRLGGAGLAWLAVWLILRWYAAW